MTPKGTPRDTGARLERAEIREWLESLDDVHRRHGAGETRRLLELLRDHAYRKGVQSGLAVTTPYVNTIPRSAEPRYPGDWPLERQIKSLVRWNAMAMVVRANRENAGLGGHISTYASCATLFEVGLQPFLSRPATGTGAATRSSSRDTPHRACMPAPSSKAGSLRSSSRISAASCAPGNGLSSYPHPWLMPEFWEFPTVSMGLGAHHAPSIRRASSATSDDRGLKDTDGNRSGASSATARCDEPERSARSRSPSREKLDNLIFVVNCNLQRLDGPVRGNGKIIQELESRLPRRGLECDQGHLGRRTGMRCSSATTTGLLRQAHERVRRRRISEVHRRGRRILRERLLRQVSPSCSSSSSISPTSSSASCAAAATIRGRSTPRTRRAVEHQGQPDRDPGQDRQGLRAGRSAAKAAT